MAEYGRLVVKQNSQVLVVELLPFSDDVEEKAPTDMHWELGQLFSLLAFDDTVHVVVVTGGEDDVFCRPPATETFLSGTKREAFQDPAAMWRTFFGLIRCHEAMAGLDKPIVARVNGDAFGFGASLMFACDFIVIAEDAEVMDAHMARPGSNLYGPPFPVVPGDGGAAILPLYLSPPKAKEFLMLSKAYTGKALAEMNLVNCAVSRGELDETVRRLVAELLERSPLALAWTKRSINRYIMSQLNSTLDAAAAYEMLSFAQAERLE